MKTVARTRATLLALCGTVAVLSAVVWWRGRTQYVYAIDIPVTLRVAGHTFDLRQRSVLVTLVVSNESATRLCLPCPRDAASLGRLGWAVYVDTWAPDGRGERTHGDEYGRPHDITRDDLHTIEPGGSIQFGINLFGLPPKGREGGQAVISDPKRCFGMIDGSFSVSFSYSMFGRDIGLYRASSPVFGGPLRCNRFRIDIPPGNDEATSGRAAEGGGKQTEALRRKGSR